MGFCLLDTCPITAAEKQVQKSATKMVLESAQMLSDCVRHYGYASDTIYKSAYHNHPSTKWVRKSRSHFEWLVLHAMALVERYENRFNKFHASARVIEECARLSNLVPLNGFSITADDLAIKSTDTGVEALEVFLESEQTFDDVVIAYQKFYNAKSYVVLERVK